MTRRPVTCEWRDQILVGTMHAPSGGRAAPCDRIGALLLNAGPAPRAGNSDLSAHIADRLADRGMVAFRFDVPGLGDSTGASWPTIDEFWLATQEGRNDDAVATLVRGLCARHQLRALILGGLCAGAISSIRARTLVGDQVAGLLLLEPNFRSSADVRAQPAEAGVSSEATPPRRHSRWRRTLGRLLDVNEVLCILTGESRLARPFAPLRPMLERMLQRRVGKSLPRDVLVSEVLAWSRMLEHEVPSLAVAAKGMGTDRFLDRIIGVFPACNSEQLRRVLIPDTNHILTAGEARHLTIHAVERWLIDRFPDAVWSDSAPAALAEPRSRISAGA